VTMVRVLQTCRLPWSGEIRRPRCMGSATYNSNPHRLGEDIRRIARLEIWRHFRDTDAYGAARDPITQAT
jgi:hypothetical protein